MKSNPYSSISKITFGISEKETPPVIVQETHDLKVAQLKIFQLENQELDSTIKTNLDSFSYNQIVTLYNVFSRLNTWLEFYTPLNLHIKFAEKIEPLFYTKDFDNHIFSEEILKIITKEAKSYLLLTINLVKNESYTTLDIIDRIIRVSYYDIDLVSN